MRVVAQFKLKSLIFQIKNQQGVKIKQKSKRKQNDKNKLSDVEKYLTKLLNFNEQATSIKHYDQVLKS